MKYSVLRSNLVKDICGEWNLFLWTTVAVEKHLDLGNMEKNITNLLNGPSNQSTQSMEVKKC